jgi:hypothetical protein
MEGTVEMSKQESIRSAAYFQVLLDDAQTTSSTAWMSQQAVEYLGRTEFDCRARLRSYFGYLFLILMIPVGVWAIAAAGILPPGLFLLIIFVISLFFFLFSIISIKMTRFQFKNGRFIISRGFLHTTNISLVVHRIVDRNVRRRGLMNRIMGEGELVLMMEPGFKDQKLRGLARYDRMVEIGNDLFDLAAVLRMHPLLKGILQ